MERLNAWAPRVLSLLRLITALLFMEHGLMKLFHFPGPQPGAPNPLPANLSGDDDVENSQPFDHRPCALCIVVVLDDWTARRRQFGTIVPYKNTQKYDGIHPSNTFHSKLCAFAQ